MGDIGHVRDLNPLDSTPTVGLRVADNRLIKTQTTKRYAKVAMQAVRELIE